MFLNLLYKCESICLDYKVWFGFVIMNSVLCVLFLRVNIKFIELLIFWWSKGWYCLKKINLI